MQVIQKRMLPRKSVLSMKSNEVCSALFLLIIKSLILREKSFSEISADNANISFINLLDLEELPRHSHLVSTFWAGVENSIYTSNE